MTDKIKRYAALAARIAVSVAITAIIIWKYKELKSIDVREIVYAADNTFIAVMSVWGVYLIKSVLFVLPASLIYTAVGIAFNAGWAVLINTAGIIIEIMVTYALGRMLGGQYVTKLLQKKKFGKKLLAVKDKDKLSALFGIRLLPLFPIDFVSLFLGAYNIKPLQYFLVSFAGIMPRVVLFTILGDKIYDLLPMRTLMMLVICLLPVALIVWVIRSAIDLKKENEIAAKRRYVPLCVKNRTVILDTDIGPDCDDAGALAVLIELSKRHGFKIAGAVNCTSNRFGNGAIRSISEFCGADIEIAQFEGKDFFDSKNLYNKHISEKYLEGREDACLAEGALEFYKKQLEAAQDDELVIITIGMLNNISNLISAYPQLCAKKINAIIAMAGKFPMGKEFNVESDIAAAQNVFQNFPNIIVCSGYEVGDKILTGYAEPPKNAERNPIYDSYALYVRDKNGAQLRSSWDLTAVQFAAQGEGDFYKLSRAGKITVDSNGSTFFKREKGANRYYMIKKAKDADIAASLNSILAAYNEI